MIRLFEAYRERYDRVYEKMVKVYEHDEDAKMPYIIADVNYWLDGSLDANYPSDYFTDPESMTLYQVDKIKKHIERYEDDYVPLLFPWYGTGVVPSALGCKVKFHDYGDPSIEGTVVHEPQEVYKLMKPDYQRDGLMPRVLETIRYMKEHTDLPISTTDPQGPLNIALCLCGVEKLFVWMYTNPKEVHYLMNFCTEVFIEWVEEQKRHIGDNYGIGAMPHGIILPERFGGIWLADDDCTIISSDMYEEFVIPYNERIFKHFNGGTIHFCGSAQHQIKNMLKMDSCVGVNNFCMGNFNQLSEMQEAYKDRLVLMACDFAPLNIEDYFENLRNDLSGKSTIVASFISNKYALVDNKYESVERDSLVIGKAIEQELIKFGENT